MKNLVGLAVGLNLTPQFLVSTTLSVDLKLLYDSLIEEYHFDEFLRDFRERAARVEPSEARDLILSKDLEAFASRYLTLLAGDLLIVYHLDPEEVSELNERVSWNCDSLYWTKGFKTFVNSFKDSPPFESLYGVVNSVSEFPLSHLYKIEVVYRKEVLDAFTKIIFAVGFERWMTHANSWIFDGERSQLSFEGDDLARMIDLVFSEDS